MTIDLLALAQQAAATAVDNREAQTGGGGEYTPPAEGVVWMRFIGYIELGIHETEFEGVKKQTPACELLFELSGPKHPKVGAPGKEVPQRLSVKFDNISRNEKAAYYKVFTRMNVDGTAKTFGELLGRAYLGTISHSKSKDGKTTYANLRPKGGEYAINAPKYQDGLTGEWHNVPVPEPVHPLRLFIWDAACKPMWDSIFIDGTYEARKDKDGKETSPARSKNVYQNKIKTALNFPGSAVEVLVLGGGAPLDLGTPETAVPEGQPRISEGNAAAADPLAGLA